MTICKVCYKPKGKHNAKLWVLHTQIQLCVFCQKSGSEHSAKLLDMHKAAVEKGRHCYDHHKEEKLYPLTVGFARAGVARVCSLNADSTYDKVLVPIYMSCTECDLYLGSTEEDFADVLDGMCLSCFRESIGQTDVWYDVPPVKNMKEVN